jgi:hypothetical protein
MSDEQQHNDQPPAPSVESPATPPQTWPSEVAASQTTAPSASYTSATAPVISAPTSSNAVVALILAILSWAVCPIIAAIVALVFASMASTEINASGGRIGGRGLVTAARIVAWIHIGVMAAVILIGLLILVVVVIASSGTAWPTR